MVAASGALRIGEEGGREGAAAPQPDPSPPACLGGGSAHDGLTTQAHTAHDIKTPRGARKRAEWLFSSLINFKLRRGSCHISVPVPPDAVSGQEGSGSRLVAAHRLGQRRKALDRPLAEARRGGSTVPREGIHASSSAL